MINVGEKVHFYVDGTHSVYLTGNYVIDPEEDDEDDEDYDEDELDAIDDYASDEESDELDGLADPRVTEVDDEDEDEAPKLVNTASDKKNKKKRGAAEMEDGLDEMIAKEAGAANAEEPKLSKKQLKKLKNNKGDAVPAAAAATEAKDSSIKKSDKESHKDKKVQFAKNLEQGPTGTPKAGSVKVVQGVTVDDRKIGTGRPVKKGDKVGVRYIGKLADGKVFDCRSSQILGLMAFGCNAIANILSRSQQEGYAVPLPCRGG